MCHADNFRTGEQNWRPLWWWRCILRNRFPARRVHIIRSVSKTRHRSSSSRVAVVEFVCVFLRYYIYYSRPVAARCGVRRKHTRRAIRTHKKEHETYWRVAHDKRHSTQRRKCAIQPQRMRWKVLRIQNNTHKNTPQQCAKETCSNGISGLFILYWVIKQNIIRNFGV